MFVFFLTNTKSDQQQEFAVNNISFELKKDY